MNNETMLMDDYAWNRIHRLVVMTCRIDPEEAKSTTGSGSVRGISGVVIIGDLLDIF